MMIVCISQVQVVGCVVCDIVVEWCDECFVCWVVVIIKVLFGFYDCCYCVVGIYLMNECIDDQIGCVQDYVEIDELFLWILFYSFWCCFYVESLIVFDEWQWVVDESFGDF